ncbi:MAG TPA: hypothetical protein VKP78_05655 [bacterium]|nr:hypothetical protein [bacterium]
MLITMGETRSMSTPYSATLKGLNNSRVVKQETGKRKPRKRTFGAGPEKETSGQAGNGKRSKICPRITQI